MSVPKIAALGCQDSDLATALSTPYVIYDGDLKVDGSVVYVPYYMTGLL